MANDPNHLKNFLYSGGQDQSIGCSIVWSYEKFKYFRFYSNANVANQNL